MIFPMIAAFRWRVALSGTGFMPRIGLVYVAIFILTSAVSSRRWANMRPNGCPVEKEKWGSAYCFSVAALCYILGQLGFISGCRNMPKAGMSLNDAGTLVSNFWMSYMVGMWAFSFIRFFDFATYPDRTGWSGWAILMYVFNTGTPAHMAWSILARASPARSIPPSSPRVHSRPKYRRQTG